MPFTDTLLNGRFKIDSPGPLGAGSFGEVWLAQDQHLNSRPVVIKFLQIKTKTEHVEWIRKKFAQEKEALCRLKHANVVWIIDAGVTDDDIPFIVMEYVNGRSLRTVAATRALELERVAKIIRQVAYGLNAAHKEGIIHRDLKPDNIMIEHPGTEDEVAKVVDFGIAQVRDSIETGTWDTHTGAGTPSYMAPEQIEGEQVLPQTDVYALGVITYELITGLLPFNFKNSGQFLSLQRHGPSLPPRSLRGELPEKAQAEILKALSFDPAQRHAQAREFGEKLFTALTDSSPSRKERGNEESEMGKTPTAEIAHVLFMDIVGYSPLPMEEQYRSMPQLEKIVRDSHTFQEAQLHNQVIIRDTGDGMAIGFFGDPRLPARLALDVARALKDHPAIKLRMGIHSGPVYRTRDINTNLNMRGGGINLAQRVMDCGDTGHILLSGTAAESLKQFSDYPNWLADLGEHAVKHGERIRVFNFCNGQIGNPEVPSKLRGEKMPLPPPWRRIALICVVMFMAAGALFAYRAWGQPGINSVSPTTSLPPPSNTKPAYTEAISYYLQHKGGGQFTSSEPIRPKQEFYLGFKAARAGYLYIVIPGENGKPQAALTARPPKESGLTSNRIVAGEVF